MPPADQRLQAARDRFIGVLLNGFERGVVDPEEYSYRLSLLEAAGSEAEMQRIVQETTYVGLPPAEPPARRARRPDPAPRSGAGDLAVGGPPGLDPLERALVLTGTRRTARAPAAGANRRLALLTVAVLFLALLLLGAYLALSVHHAGTGGVVAPWAAPGSPRPGVLGAWIGAIAGART